MHKQFLKVSIRYLLGTYLLFSSSDLCGASAAPAGYLCGFNGNTSNNVYYRSLPGGAWQQPPDGGTLTQISIGANGDVYGVNTAIVPPNNIFRRTGTPGLGTTWQGVAGWLKNSTVSPKGEL